MSFCILKDHLFFKLNDYFKIMHVGVFIYLFVLNFLFAFEKINKLQKQIHVTYLSFFFGFYEYIIFSQCKLTFCKVKSTNNLNIKRVSTIRKKTNLTADNLRFDLTSTDCTVLWSRVHTALHSFVSSDSNITIFTPSCSPRVSDEPVVSFWRSAISNEVNTMIDINILTEIRSFENTFLIAMEV